MEVAMIKNIKSLITVIIASVFMIGCSKKLDINVNPTQPQSTPSNLRLPAIITNTAYHLYSHARFSAYHSYYMTSRAGNSNAVIDNWNYNNITRQGAWRWHYFDVGSNAMGLIAEAEGEGSQNYVGVGKILLAFSYLTATDSFGDMPFSEAYTGTYNPIYDTQESVYEGISVLLDEGIAALGNVSDAAIGMDSSSDAIYAGNLEDWKAFALAIKARMQLHTANFLGTEVEALTTVNQALLSFKDAVFKYPEESATAWGKNMWGESAPQPEWQFADIKNIVSTSLPTDFFMKALTVDEQSGAYDPRLFKLTRPGKNDKYLGAKLSEGLLDVNLPTGTTFEDFANLNLGYWTSDTSPFPFILKEELYFIKSELHFHLQQKDEAFKAFIDGIRENMRRMEVPEGEISNFLSSGKVPTDANALKISDIMMQKWIALYWQSESWVDMRRYGYSDEAYPNIYYPKYSLPEWNGRWIQRFPYDPQTEYIYNPREIARLGAEARNWCFNPVWWAERSVLK